MRTPFLSSILLITALSACKLTGNNVAGSYRQEGNEETRLVLYRNNTFDFIHAPPKENTENTALSFFSSGKWKFENKSVILDSRQPDSSMGTKLVNDSITRFTNISSFSFWNRYGQPVTIRSILLPPARLKPHYGNSLYFFGQDFARTDTLKFYLTGYPVFTYPGSIPHAVGNNIHKITLMEPYEADAFSRTRFTARHNHLQAEDSTLRFNKKFKDTR